MIYRNQPFCPKYAGQPEIYVWELKEKNIPVFFEKENINTMDSKDEMLLTIMVSLVRQESQSLSQNIKLGLQYRY